MTLNYTSTRPKIGIAFSSGGAKGLAHIGVIQVLTENGFEVDAIAGTSIGGIHRCSLALCDCRIAFETRLTPFFP